MTLEEPKFKPISADMGKYWAISSDINGGVSDHRMIAILSELCSLLPMTILVFVTGRSSVKQQLASLANMNIGNGKLRRR